MSAFVQPDRLVAPQNQRSSPQCDEAGNGRHEDQTSHFDSLQLRPSAPDLPPTVIEIRRVGLDAESRCLTEWQELHPMLDRLHAARRLRERMLGR
jgi:hypothetical protein